MPELTGGVIMLKTFKSPNQCTSACLTIPECRSVNYCSSRQCDLNFDDVFSIGGNQSLLISHPDCSYYGMSRNDLPECLDRGQNKDIQDDQDPGPCHVNKKRVDRHWGPWEVDTLIDVKGEFKEFRKRSIAIHFAHGGKLGSNESDRKTWIRFILQYLSWNEAKIKCENLGGILFSDVDGTRAQLDFLANKSYYIGAWLGIFRETIESQDWVTTTGQKVNNSLLYWDPNSGGAEPSMGGDMFVVLHSDGSKLYYLHDTYESFPRFSICDMRQLM